MQSPRLLSRLRRHDRTPVPLWERLRRVFTANLPLKLFSLLLAILMWGFVATQKRGESTEFKFTSPLVLRNIPSSLIVTSAPVESVSVLVRVRRALANSVNPNQFQVGIDLRNQLPGNFEYTLSVQNIHYNNVALPEGVEVLQISPGQVPLTLEQAVEREMPIRPRFAGEVAAGYIIRSIEILPEQVAVRGPRSLLERLDAIPTRPLDVQGLSSNVEMLVNLDLPEQVRRATQQPEFFRAQIRVGTNPTRVLFRNIPVIFENEKLPYKASTTTINVHVEGPREVVQNLDKEDLFAVVDLSQYPPGDYRGITPKVVLPETVKVLEQWPIVDLFVIGRSDSAEAKGPQEGQGQPPAEGQPPQPPQPDGQPARPGA